MSEKSELLAELREACQLPQVRKGFHILELKLSNCDLLLTSPCVAVFFAVGSSETVLFDLWHKAEQEIADFKEKPSNLLPRDLVLAIVLPEVAYHREAALSVVADPYVCRKFVVPTNGIPLSQTLEDLPFWPTDEFAEDVRRRRIRGVDDLLANSGFAENFIEDLRSLGVEGIADKLADRVYSIPSPHGETPALSTDAFGRPTLLPVTIGTRLTSLEVRDFRGIRTLGNSLSLDAAVVFFYGPNGAGKTSIIDALELTTTGSVARLDHDPDSDPKSADPLINLFSSNKQASVSAKLSSGDTITRFVNSGFGISTDLNGSSARESDVTRIVVGGAISEELDQRIIPDLIRNSHFLGQHSIREFISGGSSREDAPVERFRVISKLFGREDYVRRSDKIRRLIKELQSRSSELSESVSSEKEKLRLVENRIKERKALITERDAHLQLSQGIFREVENLTKKLEAIKIRASDSLGETASLPEISTYLTDIETRLSARKTALENSLIKLESLKRECVSRDVRGSRLVALSNMLSEQQKEIEGYEIAARDAAKTLSETEHALGAAQTEKQALRGQLDRIQGLITNAPLYLAARNRLEIENKNLETLEKRLALIRNNASELNGEIRRFEGELSRSESELKSLEIRRDRIKDFGRELDSLLKAVNDGLQLRGELKSISEKGEELQARLLKDSNELSKLEAELAKIDSELRSIDDDRQRRNKLISEILRYVDSKACPLCGHDYPNESQLQAEIRKQLDRIPDSIIGLASQKEKLLSDRNQLKNSVHQVQEQIEALDYRRNELAKSRTEIETYLEDWQQLALDLRLWDPQSDFESFLEARPNLEQHDDIPLYYGVEQLRQTIVTRHIQLEQAASSEDEAQKQIQRSQELLRNYYDHLNNLQKLPGFQGVLDWNESESLKQQTTISEKLKAATTAVSEAERRALLATTAHNKTEEVLQAARSDRTRLLDEQRTLQLEEDSLTARLAAEDLSPQARDSEVGNTILRIEADLAHTKDAEEERNRLYEAVTIENLRWDLKADEDDLDKQSAGLEPIETRIALLEAYREHLATIVNVIGSEQRQRVEEQIAELEPTLNKIWKRLSAHPLFDEVRLEIGKKGRENALRILITVNGATVEMGDEDGKVPPTSFFSEGQLNVLALSIFLAVSIRQVWSGFKLVAIDDPVQQMDDFNANAFFDLIRGLSQSGRQFIIASCDLHLYRMALEKFACLNTSDETSFLAYRLKVREKPARK
jgi:DNA repair protein SbcC/Rad50